MSAPTPHGDPHELQRTQCLKGHPVPVQDRWMQGEIELLECGCSEPSSVARGTRTAFRWMRTGAKQHVLPEEQPWRAH